MRYFQTAEEGFSVSDLQEGVLSDPESGRVPVKRGISGLLAGRGWGKLSVPCLGPFVELPHCGGGRGQVGWLQGRGERQ